MKQKAACQKKLFYLALFIASILQFSRADLTEYSYQSPFNSFRNLIQTDQCNYECGTCDSSTPKICLSCNPSSNRQFVANSCPCITGFLEINQPICVACPQNCLNCSQLNICDQCNTGYFKYNNQCYLQCPANTYLVPSTFICQDYLQYQIVQSRDSKNRIILSFQFNYKLKTTNLPTTLIIMKIVEDLSFQYVQIVGLDSTAPNELRYLIYPQVSITQCTLVIVSYDISNLLSSDISVPIKQLDPTNPIKITLGAYLQPASTSNLNNLKNSSSFLYDQNSTSYSVFYVFRCLAIFIHIFPALQFIMALCYMQIFSTPLYYYFIKLFGGFGINQLPDWQLQLGQSSTAQYGDYKLPYLYYILQLILIYFIFGIFKWVYEVYKKTEVDHLCKFETILRVHIWTITILQYIHQNLLFYLAYYSIFILSQTDFSTSAQQFFFILALIVLFYLAIYHVVGAYRIKIKSYHFFITYIKEIEDDLWPCRYYLFGVGNTKKILFNILVCSLFNEDSLVICIISFIIYLSAFLYTIYFRPYENIIVLWLKIIEELSQVGLFTTLLAAQIYYKQDNFVAKSKSSYQSIDYACLAFISIFIFINIIKQLLLLKHIFYKNQTTKRTITYLHKFDENYKDPLSTNRNLKLIDKSIQENYYAVSGNQSKFISPQKNQVNNSQVMSQHEIEMIQNLQNQRDSTEVRKKFQNAVEKTKLQDQVVSQFKQNHQNYVGQQKFQSNPFVQANPFKETKNGLVQQFCLADLYGNNSQFTKNILSNHSSKQKKIGQQNGQFKMKQAEDQAKTYFDQVYNKQQNNEQIGKYKSNQNQNFSSIEKNNWYQSQQKQNNQQSDNIFIQNPFLQNAQKPQNLQNISEEDMKNQYNQSDLQNNNQNPIKQTQGDDFSKQAEGETNQKKQVNDLNQIMISNKGENEFYYNGGESIDLQDINNQQHLEQIADTLNKEQLQKNQDNNNIQIFFQKKLNDDSVQYIHDDQSDLSNINGSQQPQSQNNLQENKKKNTQNNNLQLDNINFQPPPSADNFISPEFKKPTTETNLEENLYFKKAVKKS
ncbi:transmembrane protein, putative (macronuclear) [Tetrahymena thermophila SB210]|uniref:Transmembrane protein, putative n=1 Tax=Tetrahymena thermophila (strain SB210) TaxID=312017 RepID=Q232X4_TETTS|nr:transmembrane protein, putative [Tetrahymena thermophila SB210]EAR91706.2 transmembrane protein, putative [Tetrahymena thermophila SB210]|eukprot:XP_001011951.2 transmembrane protein, putative [Tetrahymena thermophila SB210]